MIIVIGFRPASKNPNGRSPAAPTKCDAPPLLLQNQKCRLPLYDMITVLALAFSTISREPVPLTPANLPVENEWFPT